MNEQYKIKLEEMLGEITKELAAIGIHNPANKSDWIAVPESHDTEEADENLAADTVEAWNERNALVATLEPRYNNIVKALEKINSNSFGTCEVCGKEIEAARLDANPASRTCIEHIENEPSQ